VARSGTSNAEGAVLRQAEGKKRRKYADVVASPHASLAVLGCEVFGRWNSDAVSLLDELAALKANDAPPLLRRSARLAWSNRWWGLVGVATHRAIAESLLCEGGADLLPGAGGGECPPLADVLGPAH
jgi:hypothetical protein